MTNNLLNCKFYLASGWFTPEQRRSVECLKTILRHYKVKFFSPEDDCPVQITPGCSDKVKHDVFEEDVRQIDNADVVIVNTADMDTGTIFEYGYAYAKGKTIIYYNDVQSDQAKKRNLMLAMSANYYAKNADEFIEVLLDGSHENITEGEEIE